MRKYLALLVSSILGISATLVMAGSALATCGQASITVYEDVSGGGDAKQFCTTGTVSGQVPNLGNVPHTPAGSCAAPIKIGDNWNDCISSYRITLASGWCVWVFKDSNYGGPAGLFYHMTQSGFLYNATGSWNDQISSIRFGRDNASGSCTAFH